MGYSSGMNKYNAQTKVREVSWPTRRPITVLEEEGIETLGELVGLSREYFYQTAPNCGPVTAQVIENALVEAGLWWD